MSEDPTDELGTIFAEAWGKLKEGMLQTPEGLAAQRKVYSEVERAYNEGWCAGYIAGYEHGKEVGNEEGKQDAHDTNPL